VLKFGLSIPKAEPEDVNVDFEKQLEYNEGAEVGQTKEGNYG